MKKHIFGIVASIAMLSAVTACTTAEDTAGSGDGTSKSGNGIEDKGEKDTKSCSVDKLCLNVKPVEPKKSITPGHLVVAWYQFNDDGPDPDLLVGYDAPFDPQSSYVEIPFASIKTPSEPLLACARACNDEAKCPCLADPKIGFAFVAVVPDKNGDNKIDAADLSYGDDDALYGLGYLSINYSEKAYATPSDWVGQKFPEGIEQGVRAYRALPPEAGSSFERLGKAAPGTVFDLNVCPAPGGDCNAPFPNLT